MLGINAFLGHLANLPRRLIQNVETNDVVSDENWNYGRFHVITGDAGLTEEPIEYFGPDARSGHRIFITEDYLYVVGGYEKNGLVDGGKIYKDIWGMNLLTRKWSEIRVASRKDFPNALASFSICQVEPFSPDIVLFGGTDLPFGLQSSSKTYMVSVDASNGVVNSTEMVVDGPMRKVYGHAFVRAEGFQREGAPLFYSIGGTTGRDFYLDVDCLSLQNNVWTWSKMGVQDNADDGLYRLEVINDGVMLYMFGGGTPEIVKDFVKLTVFNVSTKEYGTVHTLADTENECLHGVEHGYPTPRRCHSISRWGRNVYIVGGCSQDKHDDDGKKFVDIYKDVWMFNLDSHKWTRHPANLALAVFFHDAAVSKDGCMYVFGGCGDVYSEFRSSVCQALWLAPPSLTYLASNALLKSVDKGTLQSGSLKAMMSSPLSTVDAIFSSSL